MMKRLVLSLFVLMCSLFLRANVITLADPTIFYWDGLYYLTGTSAVSSGFSMYSSPDLMSWESCGYAREGLALHKDDVFGTSGFWAPQIFEHDGSFYMAYTANELIAVAKASDPAGPYKMTSKVELPHDTGQIDPFIFIDDDGKKYMYYVRFTGGNKLYVAEINDSFTQLSNVTYCLEAQSGTWEMANHYSTAKITEGPTVIKDGGYYYLLYSANDFRDFDYAVGYAYSKSPMGPWIKAPQPIITRHSVGVNGTGHGDLFKDENGQWYYVFHTHASNSLVNNRRTAIVPITLTNNPKNKFVPDVTRMRFLDTNATETEAPLSFSEGDVQYVVNNVQKGTVSSTFFDPVVFGGYARSVEIPAVVTHEGVEYTVNTIGAGTFYKSNVTSVTLHEGLSKIDAGAFEGINIRKIDIPSSVTAIGFRAFADCKYLGEITVRRTKAPTIIDGTFAESIYNTCKLYVPIGTKSVYEKHAQWGKFKNIIEQDLSLVEGVELNDATNAPVYDLTGRKVEESTLRDGIYIKEGKTYLVK